MDGGRIVNFSIFESECVNISELFVNDYVIFKTSICFVPHYLSVSTNEFKSLQSKPELGL